MFITTDGREQVLLVGLDGGAVGRDALREFIAEPIRVQGELLQTGSSRLLKIDPGALRHTPDGFQAEFRSSALRQ